MSGQIATVEAATETSTEASTQAEASTAAEPSQAAAQPEVPEVTIQDMLVEDVSIDGMCGVY
jgi:mycofactocin precursor